MALRGRMCRESAVNELILPWPAKELSPNARVHWAVKGEAARSARVHANWVARMAGWHRAELPEGRLHLWITFYPPTRRRPDDDNMLSRFKPWRDGIADAMGIDDKRFVSHPFVSDEVRKDGAVRVRITGAPTE